EDQLRGAGYAGPWNDVAAETSAYQNACQCVLQVVACAIGSYSTINGVRTVAQMRNELAVAGYPNWQWAQEDEIVFVYGQTTGAPATRCSAYQSPPTAATPTPVPSPSPTPFPLVVD